MNTNTNVAQWQTPASPKREVTSLIPNLRKIRAAESNIARTHDAWFPSLVRDSHVGAWVDSLADPGLAANLVFVLFLFSFSFF